MKNKIIQFGEGGFLRGFVDWMLQCVNESTNFDAKVTVVQPIECGMCDKLMKQGGVYHHIMRGLRNGEATVEVKEISVINDCVNPYSDYEKYLSLADDPAYRFVVSNTTEAGIAYRPGDKSVDTPPVSFPAKVTALLWRRYIKGLDGFVFLPCELIDHNGDELRRIVLRYAEEWNLGEDFMQWIKAENIFCSTLVDRIVTGYPKDEDNVLKASDSMLDTSELFHLWVIDGYKNLFSELPLDRAGLNVIVCDSIEKYRTRKVRILNGAHTAMIPYALLRGVETVADCMKDEEISAFVKGCVYEEIIPTLDLPEDELVSYAKDVFERFENPYIRHYCASISLNSVSKFKVRVLPSLLEYIKRTGKMPQRLLFSFSKLIEFYKNGTPNDAPDVMEFMKRASVREILADTALWGADLSYLTDEVEKNVD